MDDKLKIKLNVTKH